MWRQITQFFTLVQIIPELRVGVDYAFNSKNSGTKVKIIDGIEPIITPSEKLTKAFYIVGAGVQAIQSDNYEFSAGYDMGFAKKFQSHTGTLKLRVKF
jgi:outer membrane autotransporter protein